MIGSGGGFTGIMIRPTGVVATVVVVVVMMMWRR